MPYNCPSVGVIVAQERLALIYESWEVRKSGKEKGMSEQNKQAARWLAVSLPKMVKDVEQADTKLRLAISELVTTAVKWISTHEHPEQAIAYLKSQPLEMLGIIIPELIIERAELILYRDGIIRSTDVEAFYDSLLAIKRGAGPSIEAREQAEHYKVQILVTCHYCPGHFAVDTARDLTSFMAQHLAEEHPCLCEECRTYRFGNGIEPEHVRSMRR
jgi:hypothetical protein